jgi:hypothetical protein
MPAAWTSNAWTGEAVTGGLSHRWRGWAQRDRARGPAGLLWPGKPTPWHEWRRFDVGWGLVLPDDDSVPIADRAVAADAPEPLRRLVAARNNAPILRYRPELGTGHLRRYDQQGNESDLSTNGAGRGVGWDVLPHFMLLGGGPEQLPWELQFQLNTAFCVGRLHLQDGALTRYVDCLLNDWQDARAVPNQTVVWAVDHGPTDITSLLRDAVAEPLYQAFNNDADIADGALFIDGRRADLPASAEALTAALEEHRPLVVVTTSHGYVDLTGDPDRFATTLGLPVDQDYQLLLPEHLLSTWQPDGAIWYSHACCSAGSDDEPAYLGLFEQDSDIETVLRRLAAAERTVAPLATELLSASRPARAFIGHVEPTFDRVLRDVDTGQPLADALIPALYEHLFVPRPLGFSFRTWFSQIGSYLNQHLDAVEEVNRGNRDAAIRALDKILAALDHRSVVILGDPTVAPPITETVSCSSR